MEHSEQHRFCAACDEQVEVLANGTCPICYQSDALCDARPESAEPEVEEVSSAPEPERPRMPTWSILILIGISLKVIAALGARSDRQDRAWVPAMDPILRDRPSGLDMDELRRLARAMEDPTPLDEEDWRRAITNAKALVKESAPLDEELCDKARAEAKDKLDDFFTAFERRTWKTTHFAVQQVFRHANRVTHAWIRKVRIEDGVIKGRLDSEGLPDMKYWQLVQVRKEAIVDWMYLRRGTLVGGFTLAAEAQTRPELENDYKFDWSQYAFLDGKRK